MFKSEMSPYTVIGFDRVDGQVLATHVSAKDGLHAARIAIFDWYCDQPSCDESNLNRFVLVGVIKGQCFLDEDSPEYIRRGGSVRSTRGLYVYNKGGEPSPEELYEDPLAHWYQEDEWEYVWDVWGNHTGEESDEATQLILKRWNAESEPEDDHTPRVETIPMIAPGCSAPWFTEDDEADEKTGFERHNWQAAGTPLGLCPACGEELTFKAFTEDEGNDLFPGECPSCKQDL